MNDEIVDGIDELGVLLFGHANNAYWYGSQLSIEETRKLAPYQNATGLQVTAAVLAATAKKPNEPGATPSTVNGAKPPNCGSQSVFTTSCAPALT